MVRPSVVRSRRVLLLAEAANGGDRRVLNGVGHYARYINGWNFRLYAPWEHDRIATLFATWRPEGIISCGRLSNDLVAEWAVRDGMVMVQADAVGIIMPVSSIPSVCTDAQAVARMAVEDLAGRGIRSIGFVGGPHSQDLLQAEAFRQLTRSYGIRFDAFNGEIRRETDPACRFRDWLAGLPKRTGLAAASDWFGLHVISECIDAGYRLPDDFAVVGVGNDQPWCELAPVPLTSVQVAAEIVGYRAADMLDRLFRGEAVDPTPVLIAPVGIVSRLSSDMIAADEPEMAQILRYLYDHAKDGCNIKDALRDIPVERRRMERWFRENLGRSPLEELHRIRLALVKKLLAETNEPMQSVARRCGFRSAKLMSRMFIRETGTQLSQYRRQFLFAGDTSQQATPPQNGWQLPQIAG